MTRHVGAAAAAVLVAVVLASVSPGAETRAAVAGGDARQGAADFRACAPCHSVQPNRDMTGPSLAGVWHRKAGSVKSFDRYSPALKSAGIVWDAETLDGWLKDPAQFVPHNRMTFPGIADARVRRDLIAYLAALSSG